MAQIDDAVFAEGQDGLAGFCVYFLEEAVDREQQPAILAVLTLPVIDATADDAGQSFVNPQLFASGRIEGDERAPASEDVHHVIDYDWVETGLCVGVEPRHLELIDVALLDLIGRDEV